MHSKVWEKIYINESKRVHCVLHVWVKIDQWPNKEQLILTYGQRDLTGN